MEAKNEIKFQSLTESVGKIHFRKKTVLIPEMNRIAANLFAATFRGFDVKARVLETYRGLDLGKEHTSGKECYPCQITMGDILHFIEKEKERLAAEAAAKKKAEAEGPALEDIPPDQMIDHIDAIREIMEFSDQEKEIRVMCEQSAIPKALVDIAVSEPDKLDELEKQAEG